MASGKAKWRRFLVVVKDFLGQMGNRYVVARSKEEAMREARKHEGAHSSVVGAVEPLPASKLIKMLQEAVKRHGDLPVHIDPRVHEVSDNFLYGVDGCVRASGITDSWPPEPLYFSITTQPDEVVEKTLLPHRSPTTKRGKRGRK